jgi:hypothetical protein
MAIRRSGPKIRDAFSRNLRRQVANATSMNDGLPRLNLNRYAGRRDSNVRVFVDNVTDQSGE